MRNQRVLSVELANRLLREKCISAWDLTRYCVGLAEWGDDVYKLNIMQDFIGESELQSACEVSQGFLDRNCPRSALEGIPMTIKANMAYESLPLTAGSSILKSRDGKAGYTCEVASFLTKDAGAICLGSTTMDEFGMGSYGTHQPINDNKPTINPAYLIPPSSDENIGDDVEWWTRRILQREYPTKSVGNEGEKRVVGGSSCGAAASVSLGSSLVALGTDTGGSIRLPAAWTNTVGLKPTYGTYSRHGVVSYASSLDTVGFLTPTLSCAQHTYQTLSSSLPSKHDPTSVLPPLTTTSNDFDSTVQIGVPSALMLQECSSDILHSWRGVIHQLQKSSNLDVKIVIIDEQTLSPELMQHSLAAYYILACAEASSNLSRYDGLRYGHTYNDSKSYTSLEEQYSDYRGDYLGMEVVRRILCGTSVLSSDRFHTHYEAAMQLRAYLSQQFHNTFTTHNIHALVFPTTLQPQPPLLHEIAHKDPMLSDIMTIPPSLAGLPTIAFPYNNIGMQFVGPKFSESFLLFLANSIFNNNYDNVINE